MTVNKHFAQDGTALDECMDQLVEVLAQLLEEPEKPAAGAAKQGIVPATADLRSGATGVIHVVGKNPKK
jgi:hypothetical protein